MRQTILLKKGDNQVTLTLSDHWRGPDFGGWIFGFKAADSDDNVIVPKSPQ
jgi:hypothetical protein